MTAYTAGRIRNALLSWTAKFSSENARTVRRGEAAEAGWGTDIVRCHVSSNSPTNVQRIPHSRVTVNNSQILILWGGEAPS
jgi:hypothetical protein